MDSMPDLPVPAAHEDRTALRELGWALNRLPPDQREALFMIVLQEKSYEAAAEVTGCAIGTLKSRVHRARLQLRAYLTRRAAAEQGSVVSRDRARLQQVQTRRAGPDRSTSPGSANQRLRRCW